MQRFPVFERALRKITVFALTFVALVLSVIFYFGDDWRPLVRVATGMTSLGFAVGIIAGAALLVLLGRASGQEVD